MKAAMHVTRPTASLARRLLDRVGEWREFAALSQKLKGLDGAAARRLLEENGWIGRGNGFEPPVSSSVRALWRLMQALGLDQTRIRGSNPRLMAALETACSRCGERDRCEQHLGGGTAQATYQEFCPNADAQQQIRVALRVSSSTGKTIMPAVSDTRDDLQLRQLVEASCALCDVWRAWFLAPPLRFMGESLGFVGRRLQADGDLLTALARCDRTAEAAMAQSAFAQQAVSDYHAEAEVLLARVQGDEQKAA